MRALVLGDLHLTDKSPRNRIDNIMEAQFNKLEQITTIYRNEKVDCILSVGDLFHKFRTREYAVSKFAEWIINSNIKFYTLTGNHDINGYNLDNENIKDSSFGILKSCKVLNIDVSNVDRIWGIHTRDKYGIEVYNVPFKTTTIIVCHDMILPQKAMFEHLYYKDIKCPESVKLVISGHYHKAFDVENNGVRFYNPGAISRLTTDDDFIPRVAILDTQTLEIKEIPLNVKPFDEVFKKKEEDQTVHLATDIISQIEQDNQYNGLNIEQRIEAFANARKVEGIIIKESLERLAQAKHKIS